MGYYLNKMINERLKELEGYKAEWGEDYEWLYGEEERELKEAKEGKINA